MEFYLTYQGDLPPQKFKQRQDVESRMREIKAKIRSAFHPQIKNFWQAQVQKWGKGRGQMFTATYTEKSLSFWDHYAEQNKMVSRGDHIHRYCPLVSEQTYFGCSLEILFLRRDGPRGEDLIGGVTYGGDLDDRIKVLLDALRKPMQPQEVPDEPQTSEENPCFVLLQDDRYIDHLSVTAGKLLAPLARGGNETDVLVVIHVQARLVDLDWYASPL